MQYTVYSIQYTVHSTQYTAHSTQHTAYRTLYKDMIRAYAGRRLSNRSGAARAGSQNSATTSSRCVTHVYTRVSTHVCKHVYTHVCTHVCAHVYTQVCYTLIYLLRGGRLPWLRTLSTPADGVQPTKEHIRFDQMFHGAFHRILYRTFHRNTHRMFFGSIVELTYELPHELALSLEHCRAVPKYTIPDYTFLLDTWRVLLRTSGFESDGQYDWVARSALDATKYQGTLLLFVDCDQHWCAHVRARACMRTCAHACVCACMRCLRVCLGCLCALRCVA